MRRSLEDRFWNFEVCSAQVGPVGCRLLAAGFEQLDVLDRREHVLGAETSGVTVGAGAQTQIGQVAPVLQVVAAGVRGSRG